MGAAILFILPSYIECNIPYLEIWFLLSFCRKITLPVCHFHVYVVQPDIAISYDNWF